MSEIPAIIQVFFGFVVFPLLIMGLVIAIGTAINFYPSLYLAKRLSAKSPYYKRGVFYSILLFSAIVIHLGYRIPGITSDLINQNMSTATVMQPLHIYTGEPISINMNDTTVSYKPNYFQSTWLGDYAYSFKKSRTKKDYFVSTLKKQGLKIERNSNTRIKIVGSVDKSTAYHHTVTFDVFKDNVKVAEYSNRFRTAFAGEQSDNTFVQLLLTLQQSTPVRMLLPDFWGNPKYPEGPVTSFLNKLFIVKPRPETTPTSLYKVLSYDVTLKNEHISNKELRVNDKSCKISNIRVNIHKRMIKGDGTTKKQEGLWIGISDSLTKDYFKKYLQPPNLKTYQYSHIHQTICEANYFTVMASFGGFGLSSEEWSATFAKSKIKSIPGSLPEDKKKAIREEWNRVFAFNKQKTDKLKRDIWLLRYSYDGEFKEAITFISEDKTPDVITSLRRLSSESWSYTGFDKEYRSEERKLYKTKQYSIIIKED